MEIVRAGGVSRAARVMARQQPAISSALKRLEDYLGVVLCRRGPAGFELTDQGRIFVETCAKIEELIEAVPGQFDVMASELMFQIRLLMVGNLVSPRLDSAIASFSRRYPRAELLINVAPCTEIETLILHNDAEIGIAPVTTRNERLDFLLLYREQHVPVCGANHALQGKCFADPRALADQAFILPGIDEAAPVRDYRRRHGWGENLAGQSLDLNEVKRMVMAGLGIALLPQEFLEADLKAGRLWPLMRPDPEVQDDICVISNPENTRYHAVKIFLDHLSPGS